MANPIKVRLADLLDQDLFMPRELSWLSFNARVLQEAADDSVPLIVELLTLGACPAGVVLLLREHDVHGCRFFCRRVARRGRGRGARRVAVPRRAWVASF